MGNPDLYDMTHVGTKRLIEDYIEEVIKQLNYICDVAYIPTGSDPSDPSQELDAKLDFFNKTQRAFGKTALLLSGGGTFGLVHVGVVKVLSRMNLLPRIISGSSGGAIVAAVVGVHSDEDLSRIFDPENVSLNIFEYPYVYHLCANSFRTLKTGLSS